MENSESDTDSGTKLLKWVGVAALLALPIAVLLRKVKKEKEEPAVVDDDSDDIFASELHE